MDEIIRVLQAPNSVSPGLFFWLLNASYQAGILIGVIWLGLRIFRIKPAPARFYLWLFALLGVALLPAISPYLPHLRPLWVLQRPAEMPEMEFVEFYPPPVSEVTPEVTDYEPILAEEPVEFEPPEAAPIETAPTKESPWPKIKEYWPLSLTAAWILGAVFFLARLLCGHLAIRRLKSDAREVASASVLQTARETAAKIGLKRNMRLLASSDVSQPATAGIFRPAVILPEEFIKSAGADELKPILIHEFAHIKRCDFLINLFQRLLEAVFFFHPLIWIASRNLRLTREEICDNWVLEITGKRKSYARSLAHFAQVLSARRLPATVALIHRRPEILRRIEMILDERRKIATRLSKKATLLILLTFAFFFPLISAFPFVGEAPAAAEAEEVEKPPKIPGLYWIDWIEEASPIPDEAVKALLAKYPDDAEIHLGAAFILRQKGNRAEARTRAIQLAPEYKKIFLIREVKTISLGEFALNEKSFRNLDELIKIDPANAWPHYILAGYYLKKGEKKNWLAEVDAALSKPRLDDYEQERFKAIFRVLDEINPSFKAVWKKYYHSAVLFPELASARDAAAELVKIGNEFEEKGETAQALEYYQKAEGLGQKLLLAKPDLVMTRWTSNEIKKIAYEEMARFYEEEGQAKEAAALRKKIALFDTEQRDFSNTMQKSHIIIIPIWNAGFRSFDISYYGPGIDAHWEEIKPGKREEIKARLDRLREDSKKFVNSPGYTEMVDRFLEKLWSEGESEAIKSLPTQEEPPIAEYLEKVKNEMEGLHRAIDQATLPSGEHRRICKTNLKQIGLACLIYASDYDGFFPANFEVLGERGYIHKNAYPALLKCPAQEEGVGYVYIGAGRLEKAVENPSRTVIVYDKEPAHDNGRNIVFMDGHVEWMPEEKFQELLSKEAAGEKSEQPAGSEAVSVAGRVVDEKGEPLVGAEVILVEPLCTAEFRDGRFTGLVDSVKGTPRVGVSLKTDAQGRFSLPPHTAPYVVWVWHQRGYAEASAEDLSAARELRAAPWGRVEGELLVGKKPAPAQRINLQTARSYDPAGRRTDKWLDEAMHITYSHSTRTDDKGHFGFERVPAGKARLMRFFDQPDVGSVAIRGLIHTVEAKSGQTTRVTLGGEGRPVIGRVVQPAGTNLQIDWDRSRVRLMLPAPSGFGGDEKILAVWAAFLRSEEGRHYFRDPVKVGGDRSFRIEGVPAGEYLFQVFAYEKEPGAKSRSKEPIARLSHRFTVPLMPAGRSNEPFDLGTLELKVHEPLSAGEAPATKAQPTKTKPEQEKSPAEASEAAEETSFASALALADTIERPSYKAWALYEIAGKYAQAGEKGQAIEILSKALNVAETVDNPEAKASVLAGIAVKYAEFQEYERGLKLVKSIEEVGEFSYWKAWATAEIASEYAKTGKKDKALDLLSQAFEIAKKIEPSRTSKSTAFAVVVGTYVEIGEYNQALKAAETIENAAHKGRAFYEIAVKRAEAGERHQALQIAETIEDAQYKALVLTKTAVMYAEAGERDKALEILSQALEVAKTIDNADGSQTLELSRIAIAYAKVGAYDKALNLAKTIDDADWKIWALAEIAINYAEVGQYNQAIKVVKGIDEAAQAWLLSQIATKYAKAGEKGKASELLSQAHEIAKRIEVPLTKAVVLKAIAISYAEAGQYGQALKIAKTIERANTKARALGEIAVKYAEAGQVSEDVDFELKKTKPEKEKSTAEAEQVEKAPEKPLSPEDAAEKLEEILKGIEFRQAKIKSGRVELVESAFFNGEKHDYEHFSRYIFSGEKRFCQAREKERGRERLYKLLFDGENTTLITTGSASDHPQVDIWPYKHIEIHSNSNAPWLVHSWVDTFDGFKKRGLLSFVKETDLDGEPCYLLEGSGNNSPWRFWISKDKDFALVRQDIIHEGALKIRWQMSDFRHINGIWLAHKIIDRRPPKREEEGKVVTEEYIIEVKEAAFNIPIPEETFKIEIEEGSMVQVYSPEDPRDVVETFRYHRPAVEKVPQKALSTEDAAVKEKLQQMITFDFTNTPFGDVMDFIRVVGDINIVLDPQVVTKEMLLKPVTLKLENVTVESALWHTLRFLDLRFLVKDGVIFISDEKGLEAIKEWKLKAKEGISPEDAPPIHRSALVAEKVLRQRYEKLLSERLTQAKALIEEEKYEEALTHLNEIKNLIQFAPIPPSDVIDEIKEELKVLLPEVQKKAVEAQRQREQRKPPFTPAPLAPPNHDMWQKINEEQVSQEIELAKKFIEKQEFDKAEAILNAILMQDPTEQRALVLLEVVRTEKHLDKVAKLRRETGVKEKLPKQAVYDVRDVLAVIEDFEAPKLGVVEPEEERAPLVLSEEERKKKVDEEGAKLAKLIQDTIEPGIWLTPANSVRYRNGQLIIKAPEPVHKEIQEFLVNLRKARGLQVQLDLRFIRAAPEFLEEIEKELDLKLSPIAGVVSPPAEEKPIPSSIREDDLKALLERVQKSEKAKIMTAPRVTLFNTQRGYVATTEEDDYIFDIRPVKSAEAEIEKTEEIKKKVRTGVVFDVRATISADRRDVLMDMYFGHVDIIGFGEITTETGQTIEIPALGVINIKTTLKVPDGETMLMGGLRYKPEEGEEEALTQFLLLVTPHIIIQEEVEERVLKAE